MDNIKGVGGAPPIDDSYNKNAKAGGPGSQIDLKDSFAPSDMTASGKPQQKIVKDMLFGSNSDPLHIAWSFDTGSPVVETPMCSPDGKVIYAACADNRIHAIDTTTGKEKWAIPAEAGSMRDANATLSPDGKYIFITGQNGVLECLDAEKGAKKWELKSEKYRNNFSRTVLRCGDRSECSSDGGTIYASLENRQVSAIDVGTGKKKWDLETDSLTYGKPLLSNDEKTLFIGLAGQSIIAIDTVTGKKKAEFIGGDPAIVAAAIDSSSEKLFVAGLNSFLSCDFKNNGEATWKFARDRGIFAIPPVINEKDGLVYALHYDLSAGSTIYGLDAGTGGERWKYGAKSEISASPTLSRDGRTLYVGMKDGEFAAIDSLTGARKWGCRTSTTASPRVSPDGGIIYLGGSDGRVYALSEYALEECLARKTAAEGEKAGEDAAPLIILEDGFLSIDGVRLEVKNV